MRLAPFPRTQTLIYRRAVAGRLLSVTVNTLLLDLLQGTGAILAFGVGLICGAEVLDGSLRLIHCQQRHANVEPRIGEQGRVSLAAQVQDPIDGLFANTRLNVGMALLAMDQ